MFVSDDPEEPRKCYRCGETKPAAAFSWRRRHLGQRDSFCRPCRKAYGREHYLANRERYIEHARLQTARLQLERTRFLLDFFVTHPRSDCGETDPVVLEFDHLRDKAFNIGGALSRRSWQASSTRWPSARSFARTAIGAEPRFGGVHCAPSWFTSGRRTKTSG